MKTTLTWLTLLLVGTVVGALALHLILIAVSLARANRNLAAAAAGLEAVRDHTVPLREDLAAINAAASALRAPLHAVSENLRRTNQLLSGRAGM